MPSSGCSARPAMIDAAIIMPPVRLPFEREIGAPAEDRDLRDQAQEPREAADPEAAIEGGDLHGQRAAPARAPIAARPR